MSVLSFDDRGGPSAIALVTFLPGPDRKRSTASYSYRLTYRNPEPEAVGCVMAWEVEGGRLPYQLAVERRGGGELRVYCTCADAIFRAEDEGRFCKHVTGFLRLGRDLHEQAGSLLMNLRPAS
jgi:hypothetical protein